MVLDELRYAECYSSKIKGYDHGARASRYWTCVKLITRIHRYMIHSSSSQVAPIAACEDVPCETARKMLDSGEHTVALGRRVPSVARFTAYRVPESESNAAQSICNVQS